MIVKTVRTVLVHIEFFQINGVLIFEDIVFADGGRTAVQRLIAGIPALILRIGQSLDDLLCFGGAVYAYIEVIVVSLITRIRAGNQSRRSLPLLLIDPGRQVDRTQLPVFSDLIKCPRIGAPGRIIRQLPLHKSIV